MYERVLYVGSFEDPRHRLACLGDEYDDFQLLAFDTARDFPDLAIEKGIGLEEALVRVPAFHVTESLLAEEFAGDSDYFNFLPVMTWLSYEAATQTLWTST